MSDYINGALQRSIDIIEEVESVIDDFLRKFEPWQVAVASVCGTVAVMRIRQIIRRMRDSVLSLVMLLPSIRRMIDKELVAASAKLTDQIHRCDSKRVFLKELPKSGMTDTNILALADEYSSMGDGRSVISSGHVSGAVYSDCDDKSLTSVQSEIFKMFGYSNPLHPMLFPDCRKMEAEVVRMVANMFNGDEQVRGTVSTFFFPEFIFSL
ncbi:unnamed protein product [Toxocara canis]|uniref:Dynamin_M domain-containing protein n=1 Tax=Toxocara canis TaxID=6265 RepID=A0A183UMT9_TOXCA|nr:unnamed protein product [Toxocara canis]